MGKSQRRRAVGVFGAAAAILLAAGVAWACTGMPALTVPVNEAPASAEVTASVSLTPDQVTAGVPVEIRWNTLDGPTVATVNPGSDSKATVNVKVPDVAPGVYYLVLTSGGKGRLASSAIEVTGASALAPQVAPWSSTRTDRADVAGSSSHSTAPFVAGTVLLVIGMAVLAGSVIALRRPKTVSARAGYDPSVD